MSIHMQQEQNVIPNHILDLAKTQVTLSQRRINIFITKNNVYVTAPDGYRVPQDARLLGYIEPSGEIKTL